MQAWRLCSTLLAHAALTGLLSMPGLPHGGLTLLGSAYACIVTCWRLTRAHHCMQASPAAVLQCRRGAEHLQSALRLQDAGDHSGAGAANVGAARCQSAAAGGDHCRPAAGHARRQPHLLQHSQCLPAGDCSVPCMQLHGAQAVHECSTLCFLTRIPPACTAPLLRSSLPLASMRAGRLRHSLFWRAALQRIAAYNNLTGLNAVRIINPELPNVTRQKDAQVRNECNP